MKYCLIILWVVFTNPIEAQNLLSTPDSSRNSRSIHFTPTSFTNKFSLNNTVVLRINSGDTVSTETIDAMGFDKNGVKRQRGGNPLTGPFYIENSKAGDVLAITLTKVSLNRSYAKTTETFVSRSLPKSIIKQLGKTKLIKWNLDAKSGFAFLDSAYEHLQNFKVPLHPFLGCIGIAPSNKKNEELSFFSGTFGGNLDYNRIAQSATVYLPVFHDGAYLYIGDGHAVQGDGEIAGNALETSLDVEFTVKVYKINFLKLTYPIVEDPVYIMAVGLDKSLDNALKIATAGLLDWLQADYHLSLQEATQVMSTSIEYTIAEIADREVEIVAKIKKEILKGLKKYN
ncbi:MAG: acetamidase/formamidase family protein [Bacteroidia bacterium]|nr:acetamidase/formamidase family protein [Bacteroidia bacterium]